MKPRFKFSFFQVGLVIALFLSGCGGGSSDNSTPTGTISMNVTDAKPTLPISATEVVIEIDEVSVHKSGGGWVTLSMTQNPFTIDLLKFVDGKTTHLVPPARVESGHYTQIRFGVKSATIDGQPLEVLSEYLKTVHEFDFTVPDDGSVDLTFDFDLSQSIVATGTGTYYLKPVLHIVQTQQAATITGTIAGGTFGASDSAVIIVRNGTQSSPNGEYTRITVAKTESGDTEFKIFWLIPNFPYTIEIQVGGNPVYNEDVTSDKLGPGATFILNGTKNIVVG